MKVAVAVTALSVAAFGLPAHAVLIGADSEDRTTVSFGQGSVGQTFDVDWLIAAGTPGDGGSAPVDLTAQSTWTINSFTDTQLVFGISIANTTQLAAVGDKENVLSIGFDIAPAATSASVSGGGVFDSAGVQKTFPTFQKIGVCIWSANNCQGGNVNQGLFASSTDNFVLTLGGTFGDVVDLSRFAIKFQGDYGSYEGPSRTTTEVPEPGSVFLLGAGLLGFALIRRRREMAAAA